MITGESIRPDGILGFADDEQFYYCFGLVPVQPRLSGEKNTVRHGISGLTIYRIRYTLGMVE